MNKRNITFLSGVAICLLVSFVSCNTGVFSKNKKQIATNINTAETKDTEEVISSSLLSVQPVNYEGQKFKVDNVEIADSLLPVYPIKNIVEKKIKGKACFFPREHENYELVYAPNNAFVQTLHNSFSQHRPLILSPDAIWLVICQGISIHINQHFDSLQHVIFLENRPEEIRVRNDSLEYGDIHWEQLVSSFTEETRQYTKSDFYSLFVSDFTTTTKIERTAYQIALLETYKQAFRYVGDTGCGIPFITLKGTKEDWLTILEKLDKLDEIGLGFWAEELRPVIRQFINVFDGKPDTDFWQSIYKDALEYGGYYISGWMIKFFPYVIVSGNVEEGLAYDEVNGGYKVEENYIRNPYLKKDEYLLSTLETDNFPSGLSEIEIIWNNHFTDETKKMKTFSGFFGTIQYPDKSLEPFISWAITDQSEYEEVKMEGWFGRVDPYKYWSPHLTREELTPAIYDARKFDNQSESLDYIREYLEKEIRDNSEFAIDSLQSDTLRFTVLANGTVTKIRLDNDSINNIGSFVKELIMNLPEVWMPALDYPDNVLEGIYEEEDEEMHLKIKVNSEVKIGLFNNN